MTEKSLSRQQDQFSAGLIAVKQTWKYGLSLKIRFTLNEDSRMMQQTRPDAQIFPATPDQAAEAAPLIYSTDPALFDYLYPDGKKTALTFFKTEWRQKKSTYSFSHCSTAVSGDRLLGIALGYNRETLQACLAHTGKKGVSTLTREEKAHFISSNRYLRYLFPLIPYSAYYVLFLATHTSARGMGLGRKLLQHTFDQAQKMGYRTCELDVAKENKAVDFYLKMGMEILSESRVLHLEAHGVSSHYHMIKYLNDSGE